MNGNRLSNLLVWWLVPSLFVVTASQCGSKKKMNSRGSANSASGSPERGSETSGPSREAEGDVDDTIAHSGDSERQRSLEAIGGLTGKLDQLFADENIYGQFLEKVSKTAKENSNDLNITELSSKSWLGYYKPCSRILMCLVQRGLVFFEGHIYRLSFGFSGLEDASDILSNFAALLLNDLSHKNFATYLVKDQNGEIDYCQSFEEFIRESGFRVGVEDGSLIQFLIKKEPKELNACERPIDLEELKRDFKRVLGSFDANRGNEGAFHWFFTVGSAVGRLTLILTDIERHLEVLFGKRFVDYRDELNGDQNNVLAKLIRFYKGDTPVIKYEDFPKMGFNELYDQVESALSSENK